MHGMHAQCGWTLHLFAHRVLCDAACCEESDTQCRCAAIYPWKQQRIVAPCASSSSMSSRDIVQLNDPLMWPCTAVTCCGAQLCIAPVNKPDTPQIVRICPKLASHHAMRMRHPHAGHPTATAQPMQALTRCALVHGLAHACTLLRALLLERHACIARCCSVSRPRRGCP